MEKNNHPKVKNAAICFSGLAKNFELCYPYIKKNLLNQIGSYDVFCCTEDDENADKVNLLNPVISKKIKSSEVDKIIKPELKALKNQNYKKFIFPESSGFNLRNVYQQIYKIKEAFNLLEHYMKENNVSYRYFIRIRFDFLPINEINPKTLGIKKGEIVTPPLRTSDKDQINDMFCITGDFSAFKSYCLVYDNLSKIILEQLQFNPSPIQKFYFFLEKQYVSALFFLFRKLTSKKFFKNILGFLLLFPKKFYKQFKGSFRACLERVFFYHLKSEKKAVREEKIDFIIVRNLTDGLLTFSDF
ncbi:MAG: hypothetical protein PHH00_00390 [Candidatus Nanoarchaeia archaeon]|nr:hypothetical protein [Candidatus Nanoarchaeia archaeon]